MYFIKLFTEMLDDTDLGMLPDNLWRRLIELSLMAADLDQGGVLPPLNKIAWRLRLRVEQLEMELEQLEQAGILEQTVENAWTIIDYDKLTGPISDAERRRQSYRRKKQQDKPVDIRKQNVTKVSRKVTKRVTELELESDIYNGAKAPPQPEIPKKTDDQPGPKTKLMSTFQTATGLKMPHKKSDIGLWWSNINEIYIIADSNLDLAECLVKEAVIKLRADRLTIGGPESIIKTCRAIAAERSNGNGAAPTAIKLTEEQARAARRIAEFERSAGSSP